MKPVIPLVSGSGVDRHQAWLEALSEALQPFCTVKTFEDLTETERASAKVAIVANPDPAKLALLPGLVWVQSLWAGVERLTAELGADGPRIVRLVDPQMAQTMSEAVLAWTLYLHRDMPRYALQQRQGIWKEHPLALPGERTVGILGLGQLGLASAHRLKANGFNVLGWSRSAKSADGIECLHGADGLDAVLTRSDIIVLLMPLTARTRGMIGTSELGRLRQGAAIINFARGPILDTDALLDALDQGTLGHAVLDVFDEEPVPPSSPLWKHERITLLPHVSAPTTLGTASRIVARNIGAYLAEGTIPETVDRSRGY